MRSFYLNTFDSTPLWVRVWDEVVAPRALVLVCHDVGLHSGSYDDYAQELNRHNFVVVSYDQRAFGASARPEVLGRGAEGTFVNSSHDVNFVYRTFLREYGLPIFLVGHGYGGFVAVHCLEQGVIAPCGVLLVSVSKVNPATLQTALAAMKANPMRASSASWLPYLQPIHSLRQEDGSAHSDPLCDVVPSVRFGIDIGKGMLAAAKAENLAKLSKSVPYALFAGLKDAALGDGATGALELLLAMRRLGFTPRFFGYEDGDHDLLQHPEGYCFGHSITFMQSILDAQQL